MISLLLDRLAGLLPGLFTSRLPVPVPVRAESGRSARYLQDLGDLLHRRES